MDLLSIFAIAVALAMDAFAAALACGATVKECRPRDAVKVAIWFGGFQALMPVIGWLAGTGLSSYIAAVDHWVALALLVGVGIKMIYEASALCPAGNRRDPLAPTRLLGLALATSIDALAIGVSLSLLQVGGIIRPAMLIGLVTFVISWIGVRLGGRLGCGQGARFEIAGGILLILLGIKIFLENS